MLGWTRNPIAIAVALLAPAVAFSAGFALQENSGSGLGNAYAGGAAVAEDASTLWSNAAGMARLGNRQAVGALNLIKPSLNFRNASSIAAAQQPLGNEGGDAGSLNFVPNLYLTMPIDRQWSVGPDVNSPFGFVASTATAGSAASRGWGPRARRSMSIPPCRGSPAHTGPAN
jgi:long-chain fatty acid transport protein